MDITVNTTGIVTNTNGIMPITTGSLMPGDIIMGTVEGGNRQRHVSYAQPYMAPGLEFGAYYGPSGVEAVIVYRDRVGY